MVVANSKWRAAYFACQGFATLAWWIGMAAVPACRRWFAFGDDGESLLQFLPGDVVVWMAGSWIAAWGELCGGSWRRAAQHAVAGGMACSLMHAASLAVITNTGFVGTLCMLPAVAMTWWLAWSSERTWLSKR